MKKGISTVVVDGKEYTISWGLNQSIEYCNLRSIDITQMNEDYANIGKDISIVRDLMWSAFKDGARIKDVEFTMTTYDVGDMLETMSSEEVSSFIATMVDTLPKVNKELSKPKVVGG